MNSKSPDLSRRSFVRQACCAAVGTTGILSTLAQLRMIGAVAGDSLSPRTTAAALPADYKALVCLFLSGGNDGSSTIIPTDSRSYATYASARAELAIAQSKLLAIAPKSYSDGRSYGLHPSLTGLQGLFNSGKIAVLGNVGTLVQPTTLAQYQSGKALPPQLFSHSDQTIQWQSSIAEGPFETGWGGRMADLVNALNSNNQISMSISLNGQNSFQVGKTVLPYTVYSGGVQSVRAAQNSSSSATLSSLNSARAAAVDTVLASASPNLLSAAFGNITRSAIADSALLGSVLRTAPTLATRFAGTQTAARLAMVAKLISVAPTLGVKRQIFFVQLGGFDLHAGQIDGHAPLLAETSDAMKAFYDATVELGVANQVTTFTASDFGRTYIPNAGGTDHGWGNVQFAMGGAVQGGDIYGKMPSLTVNADDDTGRGRWIPTTSVDEYNATLATWFGVSQSNLSTVLPNIGRFAKPNLGFMG